MVHRQWPCLPANITLDTTTDPNRIIINASQATGVTSLDGLDDAISTGGGLCLGVGANSFWPSSGDVVVGPNCHRFPQAWGHLRLHGEHSTVPNHRKQHGGGIRTDWEP